MKSFLSLFFTAPAKVIYVLALFVFSVLLSNCHIDYFILYKEDNESFINAVTQLDSFNYESSHYFKNTVKQSIDDVVKLSMDYDEIFEKDASLSELLSHYASIGDTSFPVICENLSSMKGFSFALVNHDKRRIYSNIKEINGRSSKTDVQKYFGETGKTLLIARSCKNPYFATSAFIDFAEHIRDCAKKYDDNFDLYIYFGTQESFSENEAEHEKLHFAMRSKLEKLNNTAIVYLSFILLLAIILLTVTGKQEPKGKTYATVMNRLPNDLLIIMYSITLICLSSLYRTASIMLITHGTELDEFWFTHSYSFYTSRMQFCIVIFIIAFINILCILKRQYKMGCLLKNTYINTMISNIKQSKASTDSGKKE